MVVYQRRWFHCLFKRRLREQWLLLRAAVELKEFGHHKEILGASLGRVPFKAEQFCLWSHQFLANADISRKERA